MKFQLFAIFHQNCPSKWKKFVKVRFPSLRQKPPYSMRRVWFGKFYSSRIAETRDTPSLVCICMCVPVSVCQMQKSSASQNISS